MRTIVAAFAICLSLASVLLAIPAEAATHQTQLYATTVTMTFAAPNGKTRTVTQQMYVDAGHGCPDAGFANAYASTRPDLKGMTLSSLTCKDSAGASRPGGPAVILMTFVVGRRVKTAVVDHLGSKTYDMQTCPFELQKDQAALVAQTQGGFPGGKFVAASCRARPKYMTSFTNSMN